MVQHARQTVTQAEAATKRARDEQTAWANRQALIDAKIEGPDQAEVDAAADALRLAKEAVDLAKRKATEVKRLAEEKDLRDTLAGLNAQAATYEHAATDGLKTFVAAALAKANVKGWEIRDGVLWCHDTTRNEMMPYDSLSGSLRDIAAIDLICACAAQNDVDYRLMVCRQEVAGEMLPRQRAALGEVMKEREIYLLSGVIADSELRIERF